MRPEEYSSVDKSTMGPGPWQDEPDYLSWKDAATGLPCLIVRNRFGALCGYVGVPVGHSAYGKDYDSVEVKVHGGLTYADKCREQICHTPAAGEPDDVWWLGFDCAHYCDLSPGIHAVLPPRLRDREEIYRTVAFVQNECRELARQLAAL